MADGSGRRRAAGVALPPVVFAGRRGCDRLGVVQRRRPHPRVRGAVRDRAAGRRRNAARRGRPAGLVVGDHLGADARRGVGRDPPPQSASRRRQPRSRRLDRHDRLAGPRRVRHQEHARQALPRRDAPADRHRDDCRAYARRHSPRRAVSFRRLTPGHVLALVAALVLLLLMAPDWYTDKTGEQDRFFQKNVVPQLNTQTEPSVSQQQAEAAETHEKNAWQASGAIDRVILIGLLATAALALVAAYLRAAGRRRGPSPLAVLT